MKNKGNTKAELRWLDFTNDEAAEDFALELMADGHKFLIRHLRLKNVWRVTWAS